MDNANSENWLIRLAPQFRSHLVALHGIDNVYVLDHEEIWVTGPWNAITEWADPNNRHETTETRQRMDQLLRGILGAQRFNLDEQNKLTPVGNRVPIGSKPEGNWVRLEDWLQPELPVAGFGSRLNVSPVKIKLRPVGLNNQPKWKPADQAGQLLRCTAHSLLSFVGVSSNVRMNGLQFASSKSGFVFLQGANLPPIQGERYVILGASNDQVALPAGWVWAPAVNLATLISVINGGNSDLAVLHPKRPGIRVPADAWIRVSRASVRGCLRRAIVTEVSEIQPEASDD